MTDVPTLPFNRGSDTSKAAAEKVRSRAFSDRERLRALLLEAGDDGLTTDEAEVLLDMKHQTCSARMNDLHSKMGMAVDSGRRRATRSGCSATVYVATELSRPRA